VQDAFEAAWGAARPSLARHTDELRAALASAEALVIAGGHVAVIVNRLRLFGVLPLAAGRPIVAWSAGAMALTERIVLFHDDPPHGTAISEVLDAGLGAVPDLVVLPDARTRLRLGDTARVGELAQRYAPATCVAMDRGSQIWIESAAVAGGRGDGQHARVSRAVAARRLDPSGRVEAWP
jgi:peptidase E